MTDDELIELFKKRSGEAIKNTELLYGKYIYTIAMNILKCESDANECVNDVYFTVWNTVSDSPPKKFSTYIASVTRYKALDMLRKKTSEKRGGKNNYAVPFEDLDGVLSNDPGPFDEYEKKRLNVVLNDYVGQLPSEKRKIFVLRYWYLLSVFDIAKTYGCSEAKVKMTLSRIRVDLKKYLKKEGFEI